MESREQKAYYGEDTRDGTYAILTIANFTVDKDQERSMDVPDFE